MRGRTQLGKKRFFQALRGFRRLRAAGQVLSFLSPNTDKSTANWKIQDWTAHNMQLATQLSSRKVANKSGCDDPNSPDRSDMAADSLGRFVLTDWLFLVCSSTFLTYLLCFHQKQLLRICSDHLLSYLMKPSLCVILTATPFVLPP